MAYGTVTQLRAGYLHQVPEGADYDAILLQKLDEATDIVSLELGDLVFSAFGAEATERDVRARGGEYLALPTYEAGSIETITLLSGRGTDSETETEITEWMAEEETRPYRVYRYAGWYRDAWYRVTAKWGYGEVPVSVVEVVYEIAVNLWGSRGSTNISDVVGVEGAGAVGYNRALTNRQRSILSGVRTRYLGVVHA